MMTAKAREGPPSSSSTRRPRATCRKPGCAAPSSAQIAHLKMLHGVSTKLSRLNDVAEIGATIADDLAADRLPHCRVFVRDGDDLRPIAFRGDLTASGSAMDVLQTRVGEGRGPRGAHGRAVPDR